MVGVTGIIIEVFDLGGSGQFFSLLLTSSLLRFLGIVILRQGFGMWISSSGVGFKLVLMEFRSRSGVYSITRNVSYGQGSLSLCCNSCGLLWKGTRSLTVLNRLGG